MMSDKVTISSLATAGGTRVLAVATHQSVRSANRTARVAERSLLEGVRPVLIPSRDGVPYFAVALRNGGSGLGVLHGWRVRPAGETSVDSARGEMIGEARAREAQQAAVDRRPELSCSW